MSEIKWPESVTDEELKTLPRITNIEASTSLRGLYLNYAAITYLDRPESVDILIDPPSKRITLKTPGPYRMWKRPQSNGVVTCQDLRFMEPGVYAAVPGEANVYQFTGKSTRKNTKHE